MKKLEFRLGLWGGVGAGKTTFLTMLLKYLREDTSSNWAVSLDANTREKFDEHVLNLEERSFPYATSPTNRAVLGQFILTPKRKRLFSSSIDDIEVHLSFIDVAGEL